MAATARSVTRRVSAQGVRIASTGFDNMILLPVLGLTGLGLVMVYSASISQAWLMRSQTVFLQKEVTFILIGLTAMFVGANFNYMRLQRLSTPIAGLCVLLLLAVLLPHVGTTSNGAQRWFQLAGFQIEPSELAKVGLTIYFAHWLSRKGDKLLSFRDCTVPFGMILGLVCLLVLKQPDMGTAIVIGCSMVTVYFVAGAKLLHLLAGIGSGLAAALVGIRMEAYRDTRLTVWLDPWKYARSVGYHTVQALIAFGRGGPFGVGLGNSQQKYVLPAPFTDSIFAVTGEELGFIGTVTIVALFVLLGYRGYKIAANAPTQFGKLLAIGITSAIVIQAFINIAVITASIPFTGVPLPFISYGGSSLVVCLFGTGVLLNISRQSGAQIEAPPAPVENGETKEHKRRFRPGRGLVTDANSHNRRKDGWARVSGVGSHRRATGRTSRADKRSPSRARRVVKEGKRPRGYG